MNVNRATPRSQKFVTLTLAGRAIMKLLYTTGGQVTEEQGRQKSEQSVSSGYLSNAQKLRGTICVFGGPGFGWHSTLRMPAAPTRPAETACALPVHSCERGSSSSLSVKGVPSSVVVRVSLQPSAESAEFGITILNVLLGAGT